MNQAAETVEMPHGNHVQDDPLSSAHRVAPILEVSALSVRFGGIIALNEVSFSIPEAAIVGLIGPNGAGKTTVFNCLSRVFHPTSGDIKLAGKSITQLPRHAVPKLGVARTFQNVALFDGMTVVDNVLTGAHSLGAGGFLANALPFRTTLRQERDLKERARDVMSFTRITAYADTRARDLPFPIRKRVELARALISNPRLLLLDEPAAGLNHDEVVALREQIIGIRARYKSAILLVEHHMNLVMSVSDSVIAIDFGTKIADGPPDMVRNDPRVIEAYLGAEPL